MGPVNANVVVADPVTGDRYFVKAGDTPDGHTASLLGDHLFGDPSDQIPPQSGKGSGRDAWAAYAESVGVAVDGDATRDDIIAAVSAAGHPVE